MFKNLINYLMPPRCIDCGEFSSEYDTLCPTCWKKYRFIQEPCCKICGTPFEIDIESICLGCMKIKPKYDSAKSLFRFDENSKRIIHNFKYYDKTHLSKFFAHILFSKYKEFISGADIIVPVPMHKLKRIFRMYNQSIVLAKELSLLSFIPIKPDIIQKTRYTKAQSLLTKSERRKNLANSFSVSCPEEIIDKRILLVDDVITTGETINTCSRVLKNNGAESVFVISVAKACL
jgi:ComF family protein